MNKSKIILGAALVASLCGIQCVQAELVTAGELIADLRNEDLNSATNVWVNHAVSTNSVGDFGRIDGENLAVLPALTSTNGIVANGLQVDQVLAQAVRSELSTPELIEGNNTRSVEVWLYATGISGSSCAVGWGGSEKDGMCSFNYHDASHNGMFSAWYNDGGWGGSVLPSGGWAYVAYTYNGTDVIGYINGEMVSSYAAGDANESGQPLDTVNAYLAVGSARSASADAFIGRIGDVRVHTGILSADDIANNYAEGMVAPADLSPSISGLEDVSLYEGDTLELEAIVSGALPISYQWSSNSVVIADATNSTLSVTNLTVSANGAVFSLEAVNTYGSDSVSMTLTVEAIEVLPPVTINLDVNKLGGGGEYAGTAIAPGAGTVWNQFNVNSGTTPLPTSISTVVDSMGNELGSCQIRWSSSSKTYIKAYKDDSSGNPNPLDLMSDYTYQGPYTIEITSLPAGEYDLYMYAHNNSAGPSTVTIAVTNGSMSASTSDFADYRDIYQTNALNNSYLYMTGVVENAGGSFTFTVSDYLEGFQLQNATPVIEGLASNLTVTAGTNLVIDAGVAGRNTTNCPMSYVWSFNGTTLTGETGATLTLNDVQASLAGEYTLVASNEIGSDTVSFTLTVESGVVGPITIDEIAVSDGTASITWSSDAGSGYAIESTSDLGSDSWTTVTNIDSVGSQTTDVPVSGNGQEFFRVTN